MQLYYILFGIGLMSSSFALADSSDHLAPLSHFSCTREDRRSIALIDSFSLDLVDSRAQLTMERRGKVVSARGTSDLKMRAKGETGIWFLYKGFGEFLGEYETSLLVSSDVQQGKSGEVRLQGRGDAFVYEDYICR